MSMRCGGSTPRSANADSGPDGIAQYVEIAGRFARLAEDPWAERHFEEL